VVIHQLQTLEALEVQVQILVQVFQEHQTVEHMQVVEVEVLVIQEQLDLAEQVVEALQVAEPNQEEMLQQILVVAVEEQYIQLLQFKVVMVVQE
jgi:hypothetical protein